MVPMNLLGARTDGRLHRHRLVGARRRSRKRRRSARVNVAASTKAENYARLPAAVRAEAHAGRGLRPHDVEQHDRGHRVASAARTSATSPLVSDTSSDMFSRPIDVARHALIYAGAQKNLGPPASPSSSSATICWQRSREQKATLPTMLNYAVHAENESLYNTPPTFGVYALGLVDEVAARPGRAGGDRQRQRAEGRKALRRDRSHRLLSRHGAARTAGRS